MTGSSRPRWRGRRWWSGTSRGRPPRWAQTPWPAAPTWARRGVRPRRRRPTPALPGRRRGLPGPGDGQRLGRARAWGGWPAGRQGPRSPRPCRHVLVRLGGLFAPPPGSSPDDRPPRPGRRPPGRGGPRPGPHRRPRSILNGPVLVALVAGGLATVNPCRFALPAFLSFYVGAEERQLPSAPSPAGAGPQGRRG
jgi:hypothetical protein